MFNGAAHRYTTSPTSCSASPHTSAIAFGNADKGFRTWTFDAFVTDDFRVSPTLTMQMGVRWDYEAPVTEALRTAWSTSMWRPTSVAAAPVIATDGIGPLTGRHYPRGSRPGGSVRVFSRGSDSRGGPSSDLLGDPSWRLRRVPEYGRLPVAGVTDGSAAAALTDVQLRELADTPLTLANGFIAPASTTLNTFAVDPEFRVRSVQRWQASAQLDLPGGLTLTNTYAAGKGFQSPAGVSAEYVRARCGEPRARPVRRASSISPRTGSSIQHSLTDAAAPPPSHAA